MIRIMLSDDRTEVDMDRVAEAFAISRSELEDCIRVGTTTYWFELGGLRHAAQTMKQASTMNESESARRVRRDELLDEALQETFPASDPIAISFAAPCPGTKTSKEAP